MTDSTPGRRRGDDLERAIFEATLEELSEVGYANLRMESVAARARAGKASLYKRWPSRAHLVRAAARHLGSATQTAFETTGDVRTDLARVAQRIADFESGPYGEAIRGFVGELRAVPEDEDEELRLQIERPRSLVVAKVFEAGVAAGTVRPEALEPRVVNLLPALMTHYFLTRGRPAPPEVTDEFIDLIVMPLISLD
ncbi:TetR/AcrR family transcriptional regulator [Glycomyces salinus]|uniref:TetR/AcrR family transcriptional regulator n=1 Tax=Glycomyces salinus TaxID=980294 RepID=UPI0018ED1449|nr:TetR/AcrR family transcriptional regulator [Glycomyces salinus]